MKNKINMNLIEKIAKLIEILIAVFLLIVIIISVIETALNVIWFDFNFDFLEMDFDRILSLTLSFVIGIEFTKMLCKQTTEAVIDVLLFTTARQMVVYHKNIWEMLIGVTVIAGLFSIKRFLLKKENDTDISAEKGEHNSNGHL